MAAFLVKHPGRIPTMARMARGAKLATERAADEAIAALSSTGRGPTGSELTAGTAVGLSPRR